jgi:hypothetical protein
METEGNRGINPPNEKQSESRALIGKEEGRMNADILEQKDKNDGGKLRHGMAERDQGQAEWQSAYRCKCERLVLEEMMTHPRRLSQHSPMHSNTEKAMELNPLALPTWENGSEDSWFSLTAVFLHSFDELLFPDAA